MKVRMLFSVSAAVLSLTLARGALAGTIWYVNGTTGSDTGSCTTPTSACKTIGHAISLASSGDSIMVAAATYSENLSIGENLTLIGASATTTIIDGGARATVVTVSSSSATVTLSQLTIQNGHARYGGGIYNGGTLRIISGIITNNKTSPPTSCILGCGANGGGITNLGSLTMNNTTVSGNLANELRRPVAIRSGVKQCACSTANRRNQLVARTFVRAHVAAGRIFMVGTRHSALVCRSPHRERW